MTILGIETSCDETAVALVRIAEPNKSLTLLANVVASSLFLHAKTGGIIPETAAREQLKFIMPVLAEALRTAFGENVSMNNPPIDAIAVTYGPGLIGSLLVGVETARTLSYLWKKPIIPVNHMLGHVYANWIEQQDKIVFPALSLVVSGGHTDLLLMKDHGDYQVIGGTRDDAAGEAFDKIGRLLGLAYPAGATISKLAEKGNSKVFQLPRPMINSKDFDFSFSGLKTAALNLVKNDDSLRTLIDRNEWKLFLHTMQLDNTTTIFQKIFDLCAAVEEAIVDVLVSKTITAVKQYDAKSLILGGGVAANQKLKSHMQEELGHFFADDVHFFVPPPKLSTDNGAMIAAAAFFTAKPASWTEVTADPALYY